MEVVAASEADDNSEHSESEDDGEDEKEEEASRSRKRPEPSTASQKASATQVVEEQPHSTPGKKQKASDPATDVPTPADTGKVATTPSRIPKKPAPVAPTQAQVIQQVVQHKKRFSNLQGGRHHKPLKLKQTTPQTDAVVGAAAQKHADLMKDLDDSSDGDMGIEEEGEPAAKPSVRPPEPWEPGGTKPDTVLQLAFANRAKALAEDALKASKLAAYKKGNDTTRNIIYITSHF